MPSSKRGRAEALELNATAASILGFLHDEPQTGWELAEKIEDIIGDFWNVTRSQIYRELKDLAAQGLVASMKTGPRDRQPYRITEPGRRAFKAWIAERPGRPNMRLPLVLQVFFGDAVDPENLARSLAELRAYHEGRLATYRGFEAVVPKESSQYDALRLGLMFQKMMISWIDSLQKRSRGRG
ncbi:MAG TPA: PadR family transcriptional regulator [Polyangiaceae bacterium]|jgi:DNA-binding PadR family transcriptional regulator